MACVHMYVCMHIFTMYNKLVYLMKATSYTKCVYCSICHRLYGHEVYTYVLIYKVTLLEDNKSCIVYSTMQKG